MRTLQSRTKRLERMLREYQQQPGWDNAYPWFRLSSW